MISHLNKNSKDAEGLKRISRGLLKFGNNLILKDEAIKLAKKENDKKFIKYVNDIYGNKNKISYEEFVKKAIPKAGDKWDMDPYEKKYQTTQRISSNEFRNETINIFKFNSKVYKLIQDYWKINGEWMDSFLKKANLNDTHFSDSASFIRYTKINDYWIHIDAIQTDMYNKIRKTAKEMNVKGKDKKFISSLLATELDSYKAGVSLVKKKHPKAKIWTMNTAYMAKTAEHIQSSDKVSSIYTTLPPKLGFKLISIEKLKKILNTRNRKAESFSSYADKVGIKDAFLMNINKADKAKTIKKMIDFYENNENVVKDKLKYYNKTLKKALIRSKYDFEKFLGNALKHLYQEEAEGSYDLELTDSFSHRIALKMKESMFEDKRIENIPEIIHHDIIKYLKIYYTEAKTKENGFNIWWGNRDMINEENNTILSMLRENI